MLLKKSQTLSKEELSFDDIVSDRRFSALATWLLVSCSLECRRSVKTPGIKGGDRFDFSCFCYKRPRAVG